MDQVYMHQELFRGTSSDFHTPYGLSLYESYESGTNTEFRISLFTSESTASYIISRLRVGSTKAGKSWSRWEDVASCWVSAKPTKSGKRSLNIYGRRAGKKTKGVFMNISPDARELQYVVRSAKFTNILNHEIFRLGSLCGSMPPVPEYDPSQFSGSEFRDTIQRQDEDNKQYAYARNAIYPMIAERGWKDTYSYTNGIAYGARATTNIEYTRNLFGKTNYRKDLVKALSKTNDLNNIFLARQFRNLVPTDWIVKYLNDTKGYTAPEFLELGNKLRKLLTSLTIHQRRRLLKDFASTYVIPSGYKPSWEYEDTIKMARRIPETTLQGMNFKSWKEFHDQAMAICQIQETSGLSIPITPMAKKIMAVKPSGDISFVFPETTKTIKKWGSEMNHCIGMYAEDAAVGTYVLLGILKDEKMIGNLQVDTARRTVPQVLGKYNAILPEEDRKHITQMLNKSKTLRKDWAKDSYGITV